MADILSKKYAPQEFSEVVARQSLLAPLEAYIKKHNSIRNLLFEGFQGSGKSTSAFIIRNMLYGNEWRGRFFDINASSANGVDVIREKVNECIQQYS
jgi:DNA polymerase III delta prime subunit